MHIARSDELNRPGMKELGGRRLDWKAQISFSIFEEINQRNEQPATIIILFSSP